MVKNDIHSQAALAINHTPSSRHMCPEHMVIHHFFYLLFRVHCSTSY